MRKRTRTSDRSKIAVPHPQNWRTTDQDEINKRRLRAQTEPSKITNVDARHPIFSNFRVKSDSGMVYTVEIRSVAPDSYSCTCVDYRINGLGICKHGEATLLYLNTRHRRLFQEAKKNGTTRIDVVPDEASNSLRVQGKAARLPRRLQQLFDDTGYLRDGDPEEALAALSRLRLPRLRISQEVAPWLESQRLSVERKNLLREYERNVQSGKWPAQETKVPLYPYQRDGMLHLAFNERALLADEMGLGKTIQAIAACALLHRLGKASRILVVTPASLKTEWEEQIQRFTDLPYQLVFGSRRKRLPLYSAPSFFNIVNYEQVVKDALDVNERMQPDAVILDEAQRIKNWQTKTAQAVKRLKSRYAFVLTGTPIENRIDELYSLMDFLNPSVLGPLFRFNRDFYALDDRGRPAGYRNLQQLHERVKPFMLRRRKVDVETELPDRSDRTFFVQLTREQRNRYFEHEQVVARLVAIAQRRPLTEQEAQKLMRELAMMRMICDTNYILDEKEKACPKLSELGKLLEECRDNPGVKVLVFSEWERMLALVRELCERLDLGYALHTGSVPQGRRRTEILRFKQDPGCVAFLSTDSGSTGLNLQSASVVINCDLPWNPARLEQRVARAWRKHQLQPVTVINLVSEGTIEHRMLDTLASKQALADGVLDLRGDLNEITLQRGRQAMLAKLEQLMPSASPTTPRPADGRALPADRSREFSLLARERLGEALLRCEERYPIDGSHSVLIAIVDRDAPLYQEKLASLHREFFDGEASGSLTPARLEVVDRATDEALKRLIDAGVLSETTRATRHLYPEGSTAAPPLSEAERQRATAHRQQASRKLKMARLLTNGELYEEAQSAMRDAALLLGQAFAVENRMAEPAELGDLLAAPVALLWKERLPIVEQLVANSSALSPEAYGLLENLLTEERAVTHST